MPEWQVFHQIRCNEFPAQLRFFGQRNAVRVCTIDFTDAVDIPFIEKSAGIARAILASALMIAVDAIVEVLELLYSDFVTDRFHESEINFLGPSAPRSEPFRTEFSLIQS